MGEHTAAYMEEGDVNRSKIRCAQHSINPPAVQCKFYNLSILLIYQLNSHRHYLRNPFRLSVSEIHISQGGTSFSRTHVNVFVIERQTNIIIE